MKLYPTPHIDATPEDFAKTVLMPGDPLRAKFIAETFLENPRLVNNVRGVQGYTGTYKGTPVSVMASGMGMPSMGIYSYELFHIFGVENIIRIGTCGGVADHVKVRDLVFAQGCCTNSGFQNGFYLDGTFAPIANYELLSTAVDIAKEKGFCYHVGNIITNDHFYMHDEHLPEKQKSLVRFREMGVLATEMESAALYMNAAKTGKRALTICTVSDHMFTLESLDARARQTSFTQMMEVALETACRMDSL